MLAPVRAGPQAGGPAIRARSARRPRCPPSRARRSAACADPSAAQARPGAKGKVGLEYGPKCLIAFRAEACSRPDSSGDSSRKHLARTRRGRLAFPPSGRKIPRAAAILQVALRPKISFSTVSAHSRLAAPTNPITSPEEHMQHDGNDDSSHDLNFSSLEQEFEAWRRSWL